MRHGGEVAGRRVAAASANAEASRTEKYRHLSQREHVLLRPDMYIGPVEPRNLSDWVLDETGAIRERELRLSLGLVQVYNEILVNAIDRQFSDAGEQEMSAIRIEVDENIGRISLWNDGGAIPIQKHARSGLWTPTLVFGEFLSGDNFDDSQIRFVGGRNGVGAKATNAYSTSFEVTVQDPEVRMEFQQEWRDNMVDRLEPDITELDDDVTRGSVQISFQPDLARFGLSTIDTDHVQMFKSRAYDAAACTRPDIHVSFNGEELGVARFEDYAAHILGPATVVTQVKDAAGRVRAEIGAAFSGNSGFRALGLVNGIRCSSGTHVKHVTDQLSEGIAALARGARSRKSLVPVAMVKPFLSLVIKVLVDSPVFDSQTKTRLSTTTKKLGFDLVVPADFITEVASLGVLDAALRASETATNKALQRTVRDAHPPSIAKLEDATEVGKPGVECTLILTEGDSAKALAVAGLSRIGRARYGVFPLKGKLLNVRAASMNQIAANEEIRNLVQIIGLQWGHEYTSSEEVAALRYQRVMIFTDQDLHGHHIAGLVINLFQSKWPSLLLTKPDFFQRFATPIVKVFRSRGKRELQEAFFTEGAFDDWQRKQADGWHKNFRVKYYKGLGTSTREEAIEYFSDLNLHVMGLEYTARDAEYVERAFEPNMSAERKTWMMNYKPGDELDYTKSKVSVADFFTKSFIQFSIYDCNCNIPLLLDGLKPSQRKVIHIARQQKGEIKVAQLAGLVSSKTNYHHGEDSLVKAIVNLAQNFPGTNNVNLLEPIGMFGTRLAGRDEHAGARYIHTQFTNLARCVFREEDNSILEPQYVEGQAVEPRSLLPVVPLVLMNGVKGIGTGWSTECPGFNPIDVCRALKALIKQKKPKEDLFPWYDGLHGSMVKDEGCFISEGRWRLYSSRGELGGDDTVEVEDLPGGVWTNDFITALETKASKTNIMMKIYKCSDHDDERVHLLIGFAPAELRNIIRSAQNRTATIGKFLGLRKRVPMSNMMLYHSDSPAGEPCLKNFVTPAEVLDAFYKVRKVHYARRREELLRKLERETAMLENKVRFIRECGNLQLDASLAEVEETLRCAGFEPIRGGDASLPAGSAPFDSADEDEDEADGSTSSGEFEYLLEMPFRSRTKEKADNLEAKHSLLRDKLEALRDTSEGDLWLRDIADFETAYEKYANVRAQSRVARLPAKDRQRDKRAAQKLFDVERKRRQRVRVDEDRTMGAIQDLRKRTVQQLKAICRQLGLALDGGKGDLVDRILLEESTSFQRQDWEKLPVPDLEANLRARGLSIAGSREELVSRLLAAPAPELDVFHTVPAMRENIKPYGIAITRSATELKEIYKTLKTRKLEKLQPLRTLRKDELQEIAREQGVKATGTCSELVEGIAIRLVSCESADLGYSTMSSPSPELKLWIKACKAARKKLGVEGFMPVMRGTAFYNATRDIFEKAVARHRADEATVDEGEERQDLKAKKTPRKTVAAKGRSVPKVISME